jgi:hypothetical protein
MNRPFVSKTCPTIKTVSDLVLSKCADNAAVGQTLRDNSSNTSLLTNRFSDADYKALRSLALFGLFADPGSEACEFSKKNVLDCQTMSKHGLTLIIGALHDACVWCGNNYDPKDKTYKNVAKSAADMYQEFIEFFGPGSKANHMSQIIFDLCSALGVPASSCNPVVPCTGKKGGKCLNDKGPQPRSVRESGNYFELGL